MHSKLALVCAVAALPSAATLQLGARCAPGVAMPIRQVQPASRVALVRMEDEDPDPDAVISDAVEKMKKSIGSVQESLSTLRVGRASPQLLDRVQVNYYDTPTPLNQLASVTAPTASQLVVDVYDKSALGDVERALMESDIGMTPNNDGTVIRLNVPQLTEDRRKELGARFVIMPRHCLHWLRSATSIVPAVTRHKNA